ncbi:hypothetical protein BXZ70DRAFT_909969 [Cristinia sonorae]|uniref:Uncharacterized protein n=1 Tax=Cristinia sonorae TaxID=1940300 RepID=A0A8K0XLY6_9AGAR|nr:hypothetical protein BXZ70DRAFT_909969 [Cristinia sonorae]
MGQTGPTAMFTLGMIYTAPPDMGQPKGMSIEHSLHRWIGKFQVFTTDRRPSVNRQRVRVEDLEGDCVPENDGMRPPWTDYLRDCPHLSYNFDLGCGDERAMSTVEDMSGSFTTEWKLRDVHNMNDRRRRIGRRGARWCAQMMLRDRQSLVEAGGSDNDAPFVLGCQATDLPAKVHHDPCNSVDFANGDIKGHPRVAEGASVKRIVVEV